MGLNPFFYFSTHLVCFDVPNWLLEKAHYRFIVKLSNDRWKELVGMGKNLRNKLNKINSFVSTVMS